MIEIDEANANRAMLKIYEHLKPYLDDGWKGGHAFALVDGWKNVYNLSRGDDTLTLEFDLKKTLPRMPRPAGSIIDAEHIKLTAISCLLTSDNAAEIVERIKEKETPSRGCMALLLLLGSILAAGLLTRYFLV
jgi:hypothetical protein